jgi:hypothetical protein
LTKLSQQGNTATGKKTIQKYDKTILNCDWVYTESLSQTGQFKRGLKQGIEVLQN